ncbi:MAG: hypothetical protein IJT58_03500 [Synergistaceae bacterium]|nr:hypothetical protein [Synergistaceae bacterium]
MRLLRITASLLVLLVLCSASWAETYYIVKDGTGDDDKIKYSTSSFASATTQTITTLTTFFGNNNSLNLADNDIIYIAKGTYTLNNTLTTNGIQ